MSGKTENIISSSVTKVECSPKLLENSKEVRTWETFIQLISHWLKPNKELGQAYITAKVTKEINEAQKIAEEAAEISANKDMIRQQEANEFFKLVEDIFKDDNLPLIAKRLKLAKLFENNPGIEEQLNKIESIIDKLRLTKGVIIDTVEEPKKFGNGIVKQ